MVSAGSAEATGTGDGEEREGESGTTSPTIAVIIPTTKSTPPKPTKTKSVTQARKWPDRMVARQEESEASVTKGPRTTITIPARKMTLRNGLQHSEEQFSQV